MQLSPAVREALTAGHLAHLVTLEPDGSPQVTCVRVGPDGDEVVSGHLGADVRFSPMDSPPPGFVLRATVERIGGVGPWRSPASGG